MNPFFFRGITAGIFFVVFAWHINAYGLPFGEKAAAAEEFNPSAHPTSYFGYPGQTIRFFGQGFAPEETVTIHAEDGEKLGVFSSNANGAFSAKGDIELPFNSTGSFAVALEGDKSRKKIFFELRVGAFSPRLSASNYNPMPGEKLYFSGYGFFPGEEIHIFEDEDSSIVASVKADSGGYFKMLDGIPISYGKKGSEIEYTASGQKSGAGASAIILVGKLRPMLFASQTFAMRGDAVSFWGFGFTPGERVKISGLGDTLLAADEWGIIRTGTMLIPYNSVSNLRVEAEGEESGGRASVSIMLGSNIPPNMSGHALMGSLLAVSGGNTSSAGSFGTAIGGKISHLSFIKEMWTEAKIRFSGIGFSAFGAVSQRIHAFFEGITGVFSQTKISAGKYASEVWADSVLVMTGSSVRIAGSGFAPEEEIVITYGSRRFEIKADKEGGFEDIKADLPFPEEGESHIVFEFTGKTSFSYAVLELEFMRFSPGVFASSYYVLPGTVLKFEGEGFAADEEVRVLRNGSQAGSIISDSEGRFMVEQAIPYGIDQDVRFEFMGEHSREPALAEITVGKFSPALALNNYYGAGGSSFTVIGSGFAAGEMVQITFEGRPLGAARANGRGGFTLTARVPFGEPGVKIIRATGELSGVSAETRFTHAKIYPGIRLEFYSGPPGSLIHFLGTGYIPGETVEIYEDRSGIVVRRIIADASGAFSDNLYSIPAYFEPGNITFTIKGLQSMTSSDIVFYITTP